MAAPARKTISSWRARYRLASEDQKTSSVELWHWPTGAQRMAYSVMAQIPAAASVSAQDRYVPHVSLRRLVTVFPVRLEQADYVLLNMRTYPWRDLPNVTLERAGDVVTIVRADRSTLRFMVAAEAGPHLLLRRL